MARKALPAAQGDPNAGATLVATRTTPPLDDEALARIYPSDIFCDDATRRCRTHDENAFFYSDDDHLSATGAALLVRSIVGALPLTR